MRLGEVVEIITGKTPPTKRKEFFGGEYPFITPTDITKFDVRYLEQTERYLSESGYDFQKSLAIPPDSICYVAIGSTVGKMCMTKKLSFTNQQIHSIITDKKIVDPFYLFYRLRTETPRIKAIADGKGSGKSIINKTEFSNLKIEIPPLETQRKIAVILSAYDDLIENNTRRIKILEEMAQTIYKEWFIKFHFPGHEKVKMVDSELGHIPEGWVVKGLSAIVDPQYGYTESASEDVVGPKYVRGTDINKTSYIQWNSVPYCPINESNHVKFKLVVGDIFVIRMADPGKVGIVEKEIDAVFASYLIRFHIKSNSLSPYYLFYFLLSDRYQDYVTGASTGTTRKSASAGVITDIDIIIPANDICEQFEKEISTLRLMLNKLLDKNTNLRCTRDLLLPKRISGEMDVTTLDLTIGGSEA